MSRAGRAFQQKPVPWALAGPPPAKAQARIPPGTRLHPLRGGRGGAGDPRGLPRERGPGGSSLPRRGGVRQLSSAPLRPEQQRSPPARRCSAAAAPARGTEELRLPALLATGERRLPRLYRRRYGSVTPGNGSVPLNVEPQYKPKERAPRSSLPVSARANPNHAFSPQVRRCSGGCDRSAPRKRDPPAPPRTQLDV